MSLVGRGLDALVRDAGGRFSAGTAIGISIQMLNGLRALHGIGYLHRDIKPGNCTIGRPEDNELRLLYLIDYGMARKYTKDNGRHRHQRRGAPFRGTVRYAATSAHTHRDYCRKDDVESWFYVMVELYKGSLPWAHVGNMNQIGEYKKRRLPQASDQQRRQAIAQLLEGCPPPFTEILQHIDELTFNERPDYERIMMLLRLHLDANEISEHPYDWEVGRRNECGNPAGGGHGGVVDSRMDG